MVKMKHALRVLLVLAVLAVFALGGTAALASYTADLPLTVTYGQTEARNMLKLINDFRTGSDAWYWNKDNKTKTQFNTPDNPSLQKLEYDYTLEQVAMQRAAEIALRYAHDRPDGSNCFDIYPSLSSVGENLYGGGKISAQAAFTTWQETDKDYNGQGHRQNMLSDKFNAVGIGHAVIDGMDFWVQAFGYVSSPNTTATAADNSTRTVTVSTIVKNTVTQPTIKSGHMYYGETGYVPSAAKTYYTPYDTNVTFYSDVSYSSDDTSIVKVSGKKLIAVNRGTTTIRGTAEDGTALTVTVYVDPLPLGKTTAITLSSNTIEYTGSELKPGVTVKVDDSNFEYDLPVVNGKTLQENVDYTVTYNNNTKVGTASVVINGIGNFTSSKGINFNIIGKSLANAKITLSQNTFTYNGHEQTPEVTVKSGGVTLKRGNDYYLKTEKLDGGKNVGTMSVTAYGLGNYSGSVSTTYTVKPADLSKATLTDFTYMLHVYTGNPIEPSVQVKPDGKTTLSKDYYTVSYKNNTEVGTATLTVTGKDGYTGSVSTTFQIVPIDISRAEITLSPEKYDFDGKAKTPAVTVTLDGKTLKKGTDYTLTYSDNVTPPSGTVTVTGIGHYGSKKNVKFPINGTVTITGGNVIYSSPDGKITVTESATKPTATPSPTATTKPSSTPKPTSVSKAGWQKSGSKWRYRNADGSYAKNAWQKIGGKWYRFDKSGYMQTGWQKIGKAWYYLGSDGAMRTGWQQIGKAWYYFQSSGAMATGWQKIGKAWYYFQSSGAMQTGWMQSGKAWYYFQSSGAMATGWQKISGKWYYFQSSGAMQTGWMQSGKTWYYFKSSGAMAAGETVNGYTFDSSGAWVG